MYNNDNLIRQKRSKQKEYDRKKRQVRDGEFSHDLYSLKREIDMLDFRLQKNS
jgi:hypothetical protein